MNDLLESTSHMGQAEFGDDEHQPVEWLVFSIMRDAHALSIADPDHWLCKAIHEACEREALPRAQQQNPDQLRLFP